MKEPQNPTVEKNTNESKNIEVPRKSYSKEAAIAMTIVVSLFIGALGGYMFGSSRGENRMFTNRPGFQQQERGSRGGGRMGSMMGVIGTVSTIKDDSITVKDQFTGDSTTYVINSSTKVTNNGSKAKSSDISIGDQVRIQIASGNSSSSDDSQTATSIELNPNIPTSGPGGMGSGSAQSNDT